MVAVYTVVIESLHGHIEHEFPTLYQAEFYTHQLEQVADIEQIHSVDIVVDCPIHDYSTVYQAQCEACYNEALATRADNLAVMADTYRAMAL